MEASASVKIEVHLNSEVFLDEHDEKKHVRKLLEAAQDLVAYPKRSWLVSKVYSAMIKHLRLVWAQS